MHYRHRFVLVAALAAAWAPAQAQMMEPSADDVRSGRVPAAEPKPEAGGEVTLQGVIEAIDPVQRRITVRVRDDRVALLRVAPAVRNFDKLFPGDRVSVRVQPAADDGRPAAVAVDPVKGR